MCNLIIFWTGARIRCLKCSEFRIEHWPTVILTILTCVNTWSELIHVCEDCLASRQGPHIMLICARCSSVDASECSFVPKANCHVEKGKVGSHVGRLHKIFPSIRNSICKEAANGSDSVWPSQTQWVWAQRRHCQDCELHIASLRLQLASSQCLYQNQKYKILAMYSLLLWKCSWIALSFWKACRLSQAVGVCHWSSPPPAKASEKGNGMQVSQTRHLSKILNDRFWMTWNISRYMHSYFYLFSWRMQFVHVRMPANWYCNMYYIYIYYTYIYIHIYIYIYICIYIHTCYIRKKTPRNSKVQSYCTHFPNRCISVSKCIQGEKVYSSVWEWLREKQYWHLQNKCSIWLEKIQKLLPLLADAALFRTGPNPSRVQHT